MIESIKEFQDWANLCHRDGRRIGLVPTMGALHEGHLSLVRAAEERCDRVAVSIFVNPTQFGPNEDFRRYPRTLEDDLRLLEETGRPEVFVPDVREMYPEGFDISVHVGGVTTPFEGAARPGHFDGVATVVLKLLLASGADVAFFGQKDYQQACVIRKMVADLNVPVEIVVCPIVREPDGLAMSSRNRYLSKDQRKQAVVLSKSLEIAARQVAEKTVKDAASLRRVVRDTIAESPDMIIDYIGIAHPETLAELSTLDPEATPEFVLLLAARIGSTRLIDNRIIPLS